MLGRRDLERWGALALLRKSLEVPGERVLLHAAPRYIRFRRTEEDEWHAPLERDGVHPMTLLDLEGCVRRELWPSDEHVGLPVILPGGEEGRLLHFEHAENPTRWIYASEFRGSDE